MPNLFSYLGKIKQNMYQFKLQCFSHVRGLNHFCPEKE
jgi:hypothetical protein